MRVLYIVESLSVGGAEKVAVMLANLFHRSKHEVMMLIIGEQYDLEQELDSGIEIYHLERKNKLNILKMMEFQKIAKKFEIIHCHMLGAFRYTSFIKKLFILDTPIIFHDHNGDIDLKLKVNFSLKYILKPKFYIAVCNPLINWGVNVLGIAKSNAFVLENTVPRMVYEYTPQKNGKIILVSNFRRTKNIEFAIELAKKLRYTIDVFGRVNDYAYFEQLKDLIQKNGLVDKINLLVNSSNIRVHLNEYSLAIHTAKSESGPLVLLEYLNAGLPFVTYNTGKVVEHIANRYPEMIVGNFNVEDWILKINSLIMNPAESLGKRLTSLFDSEFSEEAYFQKCLNIYTKILELHRIA